MGSPTRRLLKPSQLGVDPCGVGARNFAEVLRAGSVDVVEVSGWETRERSGAFEPVGQISHHTAAGGSSDHPSLNVCIHGRAGIPGPLCNGLIGRNSGKLFLISDGRANDSGKGSGYVLEEVRQGIAPSGTAARRGLPNDMNGNPWFFDWELENDGIGEPAAAAAVETLVKVNVAVALEFGFPAAACIGHREWTSRKIDPAYIQESWLRAEVARRIDALAAMSAGTGPSVEPDPIQPLVVPRSSRTFTEDNVIRHDFAPTLDDQGCGWLQTALPYEACFPGFLWGLHVEDRPVGYSDVEKPVARIHAQNRDGQLYVEIRGGKPRQVLPVTVWEAQ